MDLSGGIMGLCQDPWRDFLFSDFLIFVLISLDLLEGSFRERSSLSLVVKSATQPKY